MHTEPHRRAASTCAQQAHPSWQRTSLKCNTRQCLREVPLKQHPAKMGCWVSGAGLLQTCTADAHAAAVQAGAGYESRLTMSWMVLVGLSPQVALLDSLSSRTGAARRSSVTPAASAPSIDARSRYRYGRSCSRRPAADIQAHVLRCSKAIIACGKDRAGSACEEVQALKLPACNSSNVARFKLHTWLGMRSIVAAGMGLGSDALHQMKSLAFLLM